ncbi:ABC-F family ATP-binding cassette domain-containing protein [Spirosoma sp. BT702]|uniref:ABC-F family ATP-binding cassette domain-containing protein n=1 Tax=Spirosoma profusum TaxID=2771354 RepID=A0A927AVM4_9BACT|nr:ABC-F family ATP-binding cassette domain-containing protein [Spirosoma profusum]MBD2705255.1 ABC-F family ATP-binding cassette domain-containing protein [Spirosoma profusum]
MSLTIRSLTYRHSDKEVLFEGLNLTLNPGEKAALVGNNGIGKSTLLQLIAGKLLPAAGQIIADVRPWYVPQHLGQYDSLTVAQALGVEQKLRSLRAILSGETDPQFFTDLADDWEIEEAVSAALSNWNLAHITADQRLCELSGGQKTKVFLAGITLHKPEMILLDEPSNHLDATSREQLYELVQSSRATLLVVSHDRTLLNVLPTTLELSESGITVFGGNYAFYREQKEGQVGALQAQLDEQAKTLKQSQQKARDMAQQRQKKEANGRAAGQSQSLPRIIAGGRKSRAEQSTANLLNVHSEKVAGIAENIRQIRSQIQAYQVLKIDIGTSLLHRGKMLIDAEQLSFGYGDNPLWKPLTFQIRSGDRIRIEGDNGAGKTTLLRLLTGSLEPLQGTIQRASFAYLYLDQDYTMIDPNRTVYEQVEHSNSRHLPEHELKSLLIYSQFRLDRFEQPCSGLSGGEKMKLALCCLAVSNQSLDMLILDEPTNNLDGQSLAVLTESVKNYNGTLLVISHDTYFIREVGIDNQLRVA